MAASSKKRWPPSVARAQPDSWAPCAAADCAPAPQVHDKGAPSCDVQATTGCACSPQMSPGVPVDLEQGLQTFQQGDSTRGEEARLAAVSARCRVKGRAASSSAQASAVWHCVSAAAGTSTRAKGCPQYCCGEHALLTQASAVAAVGCAAERRQACGSMCGQFKCVHVCLRMCLCSVCEVCLGMCGLWWCWEE